MGFFKSKKLVSPKRVKKATKIDASQEKGGAFKKFLSKIKK